MGVFKIKDDLLVILLKIIFLFMLVNFIDLFLRYDFYFFLCNSFLILVGVVIVVIVVVFLVVYSFLCFKFWGIDFLMFVLLIVCMVLVVVVVVFIFLMYIVFGWKDDFWGIMFFYVMFSIFFLVWILKGFIDGVFFWFDEIGLVNGGLCLYVLFWVILF